MSTIDTNVAFDMTDWDFTGEESGGDSTRPSGEKNRPIHKLRFGRLSLAIWSRQVETTGRMRYSVRVVRTYKASDGSFKDTPSLDAEDLPTAASLLAMAQQWVMERYAEQSAQRALAGDITF